MYDTSRTAAGRPTPDPMLERDHHGPETQHDADGGAVTDPIPAPLHSATSRRKEAR
ncbi:hypothetical protein GCM10009592_24630 [Brachybacterium rhamnosum]